MNEKFGFLSNFTGIKVNLKKKNNLGLISTQGELTDNPPLRQREAILTDDDSDENDDGHDHRKKKADPDRRTSKLFPRKPAPKPVVNKILESSSSSNVVENVLDQTYCSELEAIIRGNVQRSSSNLLTHTDDYKAHESQKKIAGPADTVVGSFSDDELSSRLSEMRVKSFSKKPESKKSGQLTDTVVGEFNDDSEEDEPQPGTSKKPVSRLADTIIQSSSDDDDEEFIPRLPKPVINKPQVPKPSLPDTIIGFSDTLSGLSICDRTPIPEAVEIEPESSEESEFDDDVITVLDSDDEDSVSEISDDDQPPLVKTLESFHNCSSINSSQKKSDSDTTVNKFFNNPPLISNPERFVTHSDIRRLKQAPAAVPEKKTSPSASFNRFKIRRARDDKNADHESSFIAEDIVLPETDVSELHQTLEDEEMSSEEEEKEATNVEPSELVISDRTQQSTQNKTITQSTPRQSYAESFNISAKININLKISLRAGSSTSECSDTTESSCSSSSSSDSQPSPPPRKKTTRAAPKPAEKTPKMTTPKASTTNKKVDSTRKERQAAAPGSGNKRISKYTESPAVAPKLLAPPIEDVEDFRTPTKPDEPIVIDDDLQEILNSLYGETWKTPQLLRSCKSKTVRQDLRKSIHANNFDTFVRNLPMDLESTRITTSSSDDANKNKYSLSIRSTKHGFITPVRSNTSVAKGSSSTKKKPTSSVKKTPRHVVSSDSDEANPVITKQKPKSVLKSAVKTTPKYLDICDSDSPSEDSSSDGDFDANETWNASSDEDYADEQERIKKVAIARRSRKHEEIIFIPDETFRQQNKKLDDLLDRFEFKKPPGMDSPKILKKVSKKKLFSHTHYDIDDINFDDTLKDPQKEKENDAPDPNVGENFFRSPFPVSKKVKELDRVAPSPLKTPKAKILTPKPTKQPPPVKSINKFAPYSFLKSLDCEVNSILCNSEALSFRQNYKSKKIELTDKLFKLYDEQVFDGQLSEVPVKWNKKLLNTAGRCNNSRRNCVRKSQLELSDKVLTSADRLRCTLIHEMCHAATWILHGENGHGSTWKRWAAKANATFPELPKINVCHDYVIEYKYTYQCTTCKAKYQTHSKSKKVENVRCSICRGRIELFLNKKNKDGAFVMTPVSKDVKGFAKFVQIKYKEVKQPNMTHKEVMQLISAQYARLTVDEKQNL